MWGEKRFVEPADGGKISSRTLYPPTGGQCPTGAAAYFTIVPWYNVRGECMHPPRGRPSIYLVWFQEKSLLPKC